MIESQHFPGASKSNNSFLTPFERRLAPRGFAADSTLARDLSPDDADAGLVGNDSAFFLLGGEGSAVALGRVSDDFYAVRH